MGRKGYGSYMDATVQQYSRELSVAQGQLEKLYNDYRELETLYNCMDDYLSDWDTEQNRVEQAADLQGVWLGECRNKYDAYLWDTMGVVFQQYTRTYTEMKEQLWCKMSQISNSITLYEDEVTDIKRRRSDYQQMMYEKKNRKLDALSKR